MPHYVDLLKLWKLVEFYFCVHHISLSIRVQTDSRANSGYPDQRSRNAASDEGLHRSSSIYFLNTPIDGKIDLFQIKRKCDGDLERPNIQIDYIRQFRKYVNEQALGL